MTTLNENKMIAEFMGYNLEVVNDEIYFTLDDMLETLSDEELHYHTDWDWLMGVVLKINIIDDYRYTVQINSMDTYIHDLKNGGFIFQSQMKWQPDELINSVYEAVVEFIKWYTHTKNN